MTGRHYVCQGCRTPLFVVMTMQAGVRMYRWDIDHQEEPEVCLVRDLLPLHGEAKCPEALDYGLDVLTPLTR
ncbi:hypothetical protein P8605_00100 [Streptomyces sp. T-3]|nr:hypothetical protein [Streptomyces sp. T-3]